MTNRKMARMFVVLSMTAVYSSSAGAAILIDNLQTSFVGTGGQNQPLAKVVVGAADVPITGFGVYGQAQFSGNLRWIIFESGQLTSPKYLSPVQAVVGNPGTFGDKAQWYDIANINFTLLAGHTYAMGLIADQVGSKTFRWGATPNNSSGLYPTITANGLSLPFMQALDNSGLNGGAFTDTPFIISLNNTTRRQMSLRIFGPETGEVPEPASIIMWSALAAIGIVVGFKSRRKITKSH